jgi:hypothetical protein
MYPPCYIYQNQELQILLFRVDRSTDGSAKVKIDDIWFCSIFFDSMNSVVANIHVLVVFNQYHCVFGLFVLSDDDNILSFIHSCAKITFLENRNSFLSFLILPLN